MKLWKPTIGLALTLGVFWILIITYLFYLGFSSGTWLSDEFMKWEVISIPIGGISLILARTGIEFMPGGRFNRKG